MRRPQRRPAAALVVGLVAGLLLTGCSSDGQEAAVPSPTLVLPSDSPTATPEPTLVATPTHTATVAPTRRASAADGDVDGDGQKDSVRATAELLTVELSSGRTVTAEVHAETPGRPAVLGYGDVDADGRAEVFLETAEGASTQFATPYRFDGASLVELQLDAGPARLGMGGSVTHGDGFRCARGRLEVLGSDTDDGRTYTVHVDSYRVEGAELVLVSSRTAKGTQGDALVEASYRPDCGSVAG